MEGEGDNFQAYDITTAPQDPQQILDFSFVPRINDTLENKAETEAIWREEQSESDDDMEVDDDADRQTGRLCPSARRTNDHGQRRNIECVEDLKQRHSNLLPVQQNQCSMTMNIQQVQT